LRRVAPWLAALGLYGAVTAVLGRDVWGQLDTSIIGPGDFDNFYYAWSVWEFRRALLSGHLPGFTHDVYGQAASVPIFVEGFADHVLAVPLQSFLSPLGAYDVTVLLGFVLAGMAMHLLASEFTASWTARAVAGLVFSFSTYHFARAIGHLGLATVEMLPLCAWSLVALYRRSSWRTAALAGAGAGLVPWAAVNYVANFLVPFALLLAAGALVADRRRFATWRGAGLLALAAGVALAVAAPSLVDYPLLRTDDLAAIDAQTSQWELRVYSANLAGLLLPDPSDPLLGARMAGLYPSLPGVPERSAFLSVPGLVLAAAAVALLRRRSTAFWLVVAAAGAALALGPGLRLGDRYLVPLPFYDLLYRWPPLDQFAAPDRLAALSLTAVAVLAAIGVTAVLDRLPPGRRLRVAASAALLGAVGAALLPSLLFGYGLTALPVRVPELYRVLAAAPDDGLVLELPPSAGSAQYFQTVSHKRLAAGIVPRLPDPAALQLEDVPYYSLLAEGWPLPASDASPDAAGADIYPLGSFAAGLRAHSIAYVVLHRSGCIEQAALWPCSEPANYAGASRFLSATLGRPMYAGDGLTAWHVAAAPPAGAAALAYRLDAGWIPHLGRLTDGEPWRAMGPAARLEVAAATAGEGHLVLRAWSFARPMTLAVSFDGRSLGAVALPVGAPRDVDLGSVELRADANELDLRSEQGCVVPLDLDPRSYAPDSSGVGYRCVSFAIDRVSLYESLPPGGGGGRPSGRRGVAQREAGCLSKRPPSGSWPTLLPREGGGTCFLLSAGGAGTPPRGARTGCSRPRRGRTA
jgi:hypothetical protein